MTLAQFCIACGADAKWVQNAAQILGWSLAYSIDEARHVGLVRQIHQDVHVPLTIADDLAVSVLGDGARDEVDGDSRATVRIAVDVDRYRSDFAVRLARATSHYAARRRGRRPPSGRGAVGRAREYGLDIGLLESSLRSTAEERIRRLDENMRFVNALKAGR